MTALVAFFLRRHLLVNIIVIATLAVGGLVIRRIQRESFPATALNQASITSVLAGASAADIETKVTIPIERALRAVDGIDTVTSTSADSVSSIMVEMYSSLSEEEVERVIDDIQRELDGITGLPSDLDGQPRLVLFNPARIPALEVFLTGPTHRLRHAVNIMEPALERTYGVSEVVRVGMGDPEVHVLVDPTRAAAMHITLDEVMDAIRQHNLSDTGGRLKSYPLLRQVVVTASLATPMEVSETVVRMDGSGGLVRVKDIARIESRDEDKGIVVHGDGERGVSLVVRKRASADILRTVDAIRETLAATDLDDEIKIATFNDSSRLARDRLRLVSVNGLSGIVLVILVLLVFLTRRIAFWVAFGIPFAVLGVIAVLPIVGITINMVSMAGFVLVIGLVVDDAIVIAERIAYWRERGLSAFDAGVKGTVEMALPVIAASATTVMAFSPMWAIGGLPGRFAWAIPTIVILTLTVSLLEVFLILPAHVTGGRDKGTSPGRAAWMHKLEVHYGNMLRVVIRHRGMLVLGFAGIFAGTMFYAANFMPFTLFPQDDARAVYLKVQMPLGTPIERTEGAVRALELQISPLLQGDLEGMTTRIGHRKPLMSLERGSDESEAIVAIFLTESHRLSALEWVEELKTALHIPEGAAVAFEHQIIGPPLGRPVTVHIVSDNDARRRKATRDVIGSLSEMHGVADIEQDDREGLRQIDLRPDFARLAEKGVAVETVLRTVKAAFYGVPVTETRGTRETTRVRVRFDGHAQRDLNALLDTEVRARNGLPVPLRDLLAPVESPSVAAIHHRDGMRTTTISASLVLGSGATSTSIAQQLKANVLPDFAGTAPALTVLIGGEAEKSAETVGDMPIVALMALVGMLMIVTLLFSSPLQAFFIVSVVPLGYVGVIWTFAAHGIVLSFFGLLGAIGLSGVVVNDSIVMVATLSGHEHDDLELIIKGATERLRPILLTTLTTVVGVMPTAYGLGGRDALLSPMSLALGWGLVFASSITLFLVPSLYVVRRDIEGWLAKALKWRS